MVKVLLGEAGTGKTKDLVEMISTEVTKESGSIVCIESGTELRYNIDYRVRLIDAKDYDIKKGGYTFLKGFIAGLHSGNFDISKVYIDGLYKVVGTKDQAKAEEFLGWCETFGSANDITFTVLISENPDAASEGIKKYQ